MVITLGDCPAQSWYVVLSVALGLGSLIAPLPAVADAGFGEACRAATEGRAGRVVCADLVALDQTLVYNRFGSFNPFGMIFALRRDVEPLDLDGMPASLDCAGDEGVQAGPVAELVAGEVRLRDCKRPRPITLRSNVGDLLYLRVENLLAPGVTGDVHPRDFSRDLCGHATDTGLKPTNDPNRAAVAPGLSRDDASLEGHGEVSCDTQASPGGPGDPLNPPDWPRTRAVNLLIEGLMPLAEPGQPAPHDACLGLGYVEPAESFNCLYEVVQEGTHFLASRAAPTGGEGLGGSITHGLFGAVMAERPGTRWYRSQVSPAALNLVWPKKVGAPLHSRDGAIDYERIDAGVPVLNMARAIDGAADFRASRAVEVVHSDLNAIIYCDREAPAATARQPLGCAADPVWSGAPTAEPRYDAFREFTVFFHDELKTFYTRNFEELGRFGQLAGVRDGFAINYGASGMGTLLLANRKGIGPAASCAECLYEEFFLTSWANGDPALLEWFDDDPSGVHHSYLNDPVVFRNFHAGPKETHVFHLHAHQWFAGNDPGRGAYLDSQTVGPAQGFTYNIYHGGRTNGDAGWYVGGSGNRNRTVGDSIFHCHLYPHFAQGMWELWRVHDVFEDGTRKLPDGQAEPGLSLDIRPTTEIDHKRPGSVDPETGAWLGPDDPATADRVGTPIPALVPLPGEPLPPLPTYAGAPTNRADPEPEAEPDEARAAAWTDAPERLFLAQAVDAPDTQPEKPLAPAEGAPMPGYPFYIAGVPGHRPPQAPNDIARRLAPADDPSDPEAPATLPDMLTGELLSGGLGRHVVLEAERHLPFEIPEDLAELNATLSAAPHSTEDRLRLETLRSQIIAKALALGDMTAHLEAARIRTLDPTGTPLERAAQTFHHDGAGLALLQPDGSRLDPNDAGGYDTPRAPRPGIAGTATGPFQVNGAPPAPGAPFSDPCGAAYARDGARRANDPFTERDEYALDPALTGFRRYEVSAVQLDLIVNQAGWHDPQARIDVLTARSDSFKDSAENRGIISPAIRDDEEPFFFRAVSGECIEFRHTNELPKDLALDDFQVKTPTDTIGQHIHLVKFDVTSSDGSGNGWNYEDGTFAPDELMARRCAALEGGELTASAADADLAAWGTRAATQEECASLGDGRIWRKALTDNRHLFQTTVQRWFADPILTHDESGAPQDRTMRTVFSHDHFGPSSIQQHGFYTALLIEPEAIFEDGQPSAGLIRLCEVEAAEGAPACTDGPVTPKPAADGTPARFVAQRGDDPWIGARKLVMLRGTDDALHPDYREFALAVADFAVLYDPRDRESEASVDPFGAAELERYGMSRLLCEAALVHAGEPAQLAARCGSAMEASGGLLWAEGEDVPPAWWAGGAPGDDQNHRDRLHGDLLDQAEINALEAYLVSYRRAAASPEGRLTGAGGLAKPVAPPSRPESISVDHHDPYLVNYRNAPIPLRLGTKEDDGSPSEDCAPLAMTRPGARRDRSAAALAAVPSPVERRLAEGRMPECSYRYQIAGPAGDAGRALSAWGLDGQLSRGPETPVLESFQGERVMLRLVQGAQEVQHNFNVAGLAFSRSIDQRYPQGMRNLAVTLPPARSACFEALAATRPAQYEDWLDGGLAGDPFWDAYAMSLARCDNLEGYTYSQELGISEHFEMRGRLRADVPTMEFRRPTVVAASAPAVPAPGTDGPDFGHREASDYLYNYGSLDSLWNGAWGFVRIYADEQAPDLAIGRGDIGERLLSIDRAREEFGIGEGLPPIGEAFGDCPLPRGARSWHYTAGVIAAIRTGDVWPDGTRYGSDRRDPDGLMLALLEPGNTLPGMFDHDTWEALDRATLLAAVRATYERPEPFVMRVNAGDCVVLRYVNALAESAPGAGLPDGLGDALAPGIAPLNLDPIPSVARISAPGSTRVEGELAGTTAPVTGLRPSAMLGLSIGLPSAELIRDLPLGYGVNREALSAVQCPDVAASGTCGLTVTKPFGFYAGRMRIALDLSEEEEAGVDPVVALTSEIGRALGDRFGGVTDPQAAEDAPDFTVLGRGFVLNLERAGQRVDLTAAERYDAQLVADMMVDERTHWIPYAFGPVPVRATGDVISQTVHGLFGTIDVTPVHWPLPGAPLDTPPGYDDFVARLNALGTPDAFAPREWRVAPHVRGFGAPHAIDASLSPAAGGEDAPIRLREFVIFIQDGLNHLDESRGGGLTGSKIAWSMSASGPAPVATAADAVSQPLPRLTPDCLVCDDSYDLGEQGVSYRSRPFATLLRPDDIAGRGRIEATDDFNALVFPPDLHAGFVRDDGRPRPTEDWAPLTLEACKGEQVVIRVVDPGGRARQHAFVMNGLGYDDLFPGFGFPNSALLGPGKSVSAWLHPPSVLGPDGEREPVAGKVLWHDGTSFLMAGGIWGLVSFGDTVGTASCRQ